MRFVYKVGIVSCLLGFFVMSHNAFAVDTTIDISNYDVISNAVTLNVNCKFNVGSLDKTNIGVCGGLPSASDLPSDGQIIMQRFYSNNSYTFKTGDIIEFDILIFTQNAGAINGEFSMQNANIINYPFRVLSVKQSNSYDLSDLERYTSGEYYNSHSFYSVYHYELIYVGPDNGSYQIGWNSGYATLFKYFGTFQFRMVNYIQYRPGEKSQINKEQEEATQNAADESENAAQDNSSNGQTTNLIGAFQSFVTALTSLNATNCNVNLPFPSNLGGSMQVNICQNKDYAGNIVSVFGSLTLIVFYIPFSLKLLTMIYNEIRSFTNG